MLLHVLQSLQRCQNASEFGSSEDVVAGSVDIIRCEVFVEQFRVDISGDIHRSAVGQFAERLFAVSSRDITHGVDSNEFVFTNAAVTC